MTETRREMPDGGTLIVRDLNNTISEIAILKKGRIIKIGTLDKLKRELRVFRNRELHEHHRTRSYGFNAFLMENSKLILNIRIHENNEGVNAEYLLSRNMLLEFGTRMNFIGELQIFYPIRDLERVKI